MTPPSSDSLDTKALQPSQRPIFWTFLPLALMWLMMGLEMPIISGVVSRLALPKENLAAHGVAMSLTILTQSPVIQLLAAATALSGAVASYRRLLLFAHRLVIALTVVHLLIGLTPLYLIVARGIMGVPAEVAERSRLPFLIMTPWSASVGYRRLWQGVLIRHGKAGIIPATMLTRLAAVLGAGLLAVIVGALPGAAAGAAVATFGLAVGMAVSGLFARPVIRRLPERQKGESALTRAGLTNFYFPLALTSFMLVAVRPILTAGLARAAFPLESLALWPVVTALIFVFQSVAISYQEVVVALGQDEESRRRLRRFANTVGLILGVVYGVVMIPQVSDLWFRHVAGLPEDLIPFARWPVVLFLPTIVLTMIVVYYRGVLVQQRRTQGISLGVGANAAVIAGVLFLATYLPGPGVNYAAASVGLAMGAQAIVLRSRVKRLRLTEA